MHRSSMYIVRMSPLDFSLPYSSQREPVLARNVVATSQPLAAQAGISMLQQGGNAVDAALAAAITLTVVEPTSNGIGSDAFALVWDNGKLHGLNASGRSPRAMSPERFAQRDEMPALGWDSVTVPGAVSGWAALSERFGKLPFELLFGPAIDYANEGYLVSPQTARNWARAVERYREFDAFGATFLPHGCAPAPGERFVCPAQAESLEIIAESAGEDFYRGELAERIVADSGSNGGVMSADDLAQHVCDWVEPIAIDYRDLRLHEIPPNGQGLAALIALGILNRFNLADHAVDSVDSLHLQVEAMKLAFADAKRFIADPNYMTVQPDALLDDAYLAERAKLIDVNKARDPGFGVPRYSSTVYLCAADESGMMVSFIQSNFEGFGSGIVIPGTGIAMQNRGAGFTLEANHPNQIGGGKRPFHTIIPAFVTRSEKTAEAQRRGGNVIDSYPEPEKCFSSSASPRLRGESAPVMAFGVMGGPMQPQGHLQVMVRLADYDQNPQSALDAPRWRVLGGREVLIEPGFPVDLYDGLRERGHAVTIAEARTVQHGGGQCVYRLPDGYFGASDPRRDGQAVGW